MSSIRMISNNFTDKHYIYNFITTDHQIHDYRIVLSNELGDLTKFISSDGDFLTVSFDKDKNEEGSMYVLKILEYGKVIYTKRIYLKTLFSNGMITKGYEAESKKEESAPIKEEAVSQSNNEVKTKTVKKTTKELDYVFDEQELIDFVKELFEVE